MPRISQVFFIHRPAVPILSVEIVTTLPELPVNIRHNFKAVMAKVEKAGELIADVPFVGFHHFQTMTEDAMKVKIGFPVPVWFESKDGIDYEILPAGISAVCMYRGSYAGLMPVYEYMLAEIAAKGYKTGDISYEYYYNGHEVAEEDLLTKIEIPVTKL